MTNLKKFNELYQLGYGHVGENVEKINGKWVRKAHIAVGTVAVPGTTVYFVANEDGRTNDPVSSIEEARDMALKLA